MTAELTTAKDSKLMYNEKAIPFIIYQGSIWLQLETCVAMSKENWKKYIVLDGGEPNAYFETPKSPEFLISKFDDGVQGWTLTKVCRISNLAPEQIRKTGYNMTQKKLKLKANLKKVKPPQ